MSGGGGGGCKMEECSGVNRRPVVRVDSNLEERDRTCVNGGMSFAYITRFIQII